MARRKNVKRIDPRYFLHETVNRNDDGSVFEEGKREEIQALIDAGMISPEEAKNMLAGRRGDQAAPGAPIPGLADWDDDDVDPLQEAEGESAEELEEDIFDSIGNAAARVGAFGKEDKKREFWRRKGEKEAMEWYDVAAAGNKGKYIHSTEKDEILRKVEDLFATQSHKVNNEVVRALVTQEVEAANRAGKRDQKDGADRERGRERDYQAGVEKRASTVARAKEEARLQDIEDDRAFARSEKTANIRGSYIPSAGSSTNTTRRRNRGELEE